MRYFYKYLKYPFKSIQKRYKICGNFLLWDKAYRFKQKCCRCLYCLLL